MDKVFAFLQSELNIDYTLTDDPDDTIDTVVSDVELDCIPIASIESDNELQINYEQYEMLNELFMDINNDLGILKDYFQRWTMIRNHL